MTMAANWEETSSKGRVPKKNSGKIPLLTNPPRTPPSPLRFGLFSEEEENLPVIFFENETSFTLGPPSPLQRRFNQITRCLSALADTLI